ncbi:MAG: aspartyl/glutamyl-tRNA amidotransferase subunit A [Gammaproteobacteria bacterium RIFCSPHIGHO2_12_FULL_42_13]|nr:MAG: aspartyl/glutamyl-tRNA amidotransferase subunit A [Gammaproteobacteria bacterium RIFCSPHIGHO2_12_FULL_42_13]
MFKKSVAELSTLLRTKKISAKELTTIFLDRVKKRDKLLNSFITVTETTALKQAEAADQSIAAGNAHPLTGIPIAQKDIFCTKDIKTTCGSKMLDNFIAPYNATVIEKCNYAGLVMLGKTNMDEFAMGSSNENSFYGPVKNPWDTARTPGGSSGGSAAAVAAGLAPIATGTDTGGSIRQPAALSGVTGLKPTYGRVSRYGMIAFASSLDQGGILSRSAEDAAMLLNVIAGHDDKDSTSVNEPVPDYTKTLKDTLKGKKIGLPKEYFTGGLEAGVEQCMENALQEFKKLGCEFVDISLPHTDYATSVYYVIAPAEASSNLARYDGVRFGYRCKDPQSLDDLYKRTRTEGFGEEVKRRIMTGTYVLSSGFYDAYYLKAQKVRRLIRDDFIEAYQQVDFIFTPTAPTPAFLIGEKSNDPVAMYLSDIFTIAANLAGLPGISLPAGFSKNLPVGIQLLGKHFDEALLLNVGYQFQQATEWHKKFPQNAEGKHYEV